MSPESNKTFKVLGILLGYPEAEWLDGVDELCRIIEQEHILGDKDKMAICALARDLAGQDRFDVQEAYVDTFDRVRSLSLHLFEHVHGEARERGQAMVDLAKIYEEKGLALAKSELPDYLPAFLEFLSHLPRPEAIEMLEDSVHILLAIAKRLAERGNPYHVIFDGMVRLTGRIPIKAEHRTAPTAPSFLELDKEWEEKAVDFMGAQTPQSGCAQSNCGGSCSGKPQATAQPAPGARS